MNETERKIAADVKAAMKNIDGLSVRDEHGSPLVFTITYQGRDIKISALRTVPDTMAYELSKRLGSILFWGQGKEGEW